MIAAAYWAGYLATHPAWPLIFAACCAAAAVYVWCMRAEDKRDDRAAGLPQAPRRGTRFRAGARAALARGTSWGRRAIALRIHGIAIDITGASVWADRNAGRFDSALGSPANGHSLSGEAGLPTLAPPEHPETPANAPEQPRTAPDACEHGWPGADCGSAHPYMTEPARLATGAERAAAAPWYAPELAPPAALSPWEHQTMWFTLDAIDADIKARAAAGGEA